MKKVIFILFILSLAPVFIQWNAPPIYDDKSLLEDNLFIRNQDYRSIWNHSYWQGARGNNQENLHRPLFLCMVSFFHSHPNLLKALCHLGHFLLGILLMIILCRHFRFDQKDDRYILFFSAAIFLFHPTQVEVSAQIIGLMEIMPFLLGLVSLLLVSSHAWFAIALVSIAPGFKETGYLSVFFVLIRLYQERKKAQLLIGSFLPILWLSHRYAISGSFIEFGQAPYALLNPFVEMSFFDRVWSVFTLMGYHIRLFVFPYPLSSDYSRGTLPLPGYPLQVFVLLAFSFFVLLGNILYSKNKRSEILFALFPLAFVVSTLQIFSPIGIVFAERFGYAFRFGLLLLLIPFVKNKKGVFSCALVVLCFYFLSIQRHFEWTSAETLFKKDITHFPQNAKLHFNLAMTYGGQARWVEAEKEFQSALFLAPDFPEAHFRMGLVYKALKNEDQAKIHLGIARELGY